jgi:hypothetical protein
MLMNTRRRALALLAAAVGLRFVSFPSRAQAKTDCFASQAVGPWKGVATNTQAGARISQLAFSNPDACDLRAEVSIGTNFDGKLVLYGDPDKTPLPKTFLVKPENRLILRTEDGKTVVDEPLCGTCTDIHDDKVSIVLPLAVAPYLQSENAVELAVKLGDAEECRAKLDCGTLRKALGWAAQRQTALAEQYAAQSCTPPQGCFITTACCELLGLADDCFELRTLRRYRDDILAKQPWAAAAIARYYAEAPAILRRLPAGERTPRLLQTYARFILPAAIAARFGFAGLAYRRYARMMHELEDYSRNQIDRASY